MHREALGRGAGGGLAGGCGCEHFAAAVMAALPAREEPEGATEDAHECVVQPARCEVVTRQQLQEDAVHLRSCKRQAAIQKLIQHVVQQRGVVGFGLARVRVGNAIRRAADNVPDYKLGRAAIPAVAGRHARVAVGPDLQQAPSAFLLEGVARVPAGRQVRADVVGEVRFQLKDPCGSGARHSRLAAAAGDAGACAARAHGVNGRMMLVSCQVSPVRVSTKRMLRSALMFSRIVNWLVLS